MTTEDSVKPRAWSTYHGLNRLLVGNMHLAVPTVKVSHTAFADHRIIFCLCFQFREEDYSFDQIKDKLVLNIDYIDQSLNITAVDLVLFFELQLSVRSTKTKLLYDTLIILLLCLYTVNGRRHRTQCNTYQ